ncbi:hypothetical protein BOX15_Mlig019118g1 [Macrostomum lignano]|uniref:Uncharacterized protein n=2 Tax=Macrostomum lignano TaxID=282301 RepID=A0A267EJN8_9PLAT|nr:hypothetical protein BOX15_Mlig019118g1 [Macrostomum lignano]
MSYQSTSLLIRALLLPNAWQRSCCLATVAAVKRHQPLIKFPSRRNGGVASSTGSQRSARPSLSASQSGNWKEDFMTLEARYQRQRIDDREIEAINSGGASLY